ncbi:MAG: TetR/AcrR family transcriptional regulator [Sandaracinaceae bacterium]
MTVRQQILDAATRRFAQQGFAGTSLAHIAEDVGVAKPSVLYHFPSKDRLRQAVLDRVLGRWGEVLPAVLSAAAAEDRFDALVAEAVRFFQADPNRARLLVREFLDRPEEMRGELRRRVRPWVRDVAQAVRRGQERGHHDPDADPEAYVLLVIQAVVGTLAVLDPLEAVLDGRPPHVGRVTEELLRAARAALFTAEGQARVSARQQERDRGARRAAE